METISTGDVFEARSEILDVYLEFEKVKRSIEATQARLLDTANTYTKLTDTSQFADRSFRAELATIVQIPEATAGSLIANSQTLVNELPATLDALTAGTISYRHAEKIVDNATSLPVQSRAAFEAAVLPAAEVMTVTKFAERARKIRERLHPESITDRHVAALESRTVGIDRGRDGMSWLTAYLPAEQAEAIDNRLTDIARSFRTEHEERTLPQLRADALADLLINGDTANRRDIVAQVMVTVPVMTLLGLCDEPGNLDGYGPIAPEVARELCATAPSFTRLLTHPITGVVLTMDRTKYLPPKDLRAWIRLRDGTCRFPGCNTKARKADIDHTLDWLYGGPTDLDNLACLCESHHRLKHNSRWKVTQVGNGVLRWTSPDGREHITRPELELTA